MGVRVRWPHLFNALCQQLALVVARQAQPALSHQELGGFPRQQRTGQAIPQVHHLIHTPAAQVGDDGFKSGEVAVDVREKG